MATILGFDWLVIYGMILCFQVNLVVLCLYLWMSQVITPYSQA